MAATVSLVTPHLRRYSRTPFSVRLSRFLPILAIVVVHFVVDIDNIVAVVVVVEIDGDFVPSIEFVRRFVRRVFFGNIKFDR